MVTTRRATARARGEDEPRKRYAELEDLEAEDLEEGLEESPEVESEEEEGAASKKKGPKKGGKAKTKGKKAGGKGAQKRASRREDESPSEGSEAAAEAAQEPEPKKARVEEEEQEAMEESEEEDEGQPAGEAEGEGEEEAEAAGGAEVEEVPETQEPEEGLAPETQEPAAPAQAEKATEEHGVGEEEHEAPTAEPEEGAGTAAEVGETEEGAQPAEQTEQEAPSAGAVVEQGRISFYYRPKVGVEDAESLQDVQRFYMVLAPVGGPKARLAVVGKKRLPSVEKHERFFGFIEAVADSVEGLTSDLGEKTYETKTRGTRTVAAARAVGEGTYAILNRGGTGAGAGRTNLVMKLEVPATPGEVQEDFSIPAEGSYAFSVKNPSNEPGPGAAAIGLQEKADFPEEKKKEFGGYAWIGVTDPSLLNFARCEFLLVATSEEPAAELGASAQELAGADAERECPDADEECLLQQLKEETKAEDVGIEMAPIETGEWA